MTDPELLRIANDSGFPLQIALQHSVNGATANHGWRVLHSEHSWTNPADGQSGFIDLVVRDAHDCANFVIECKRVRNATWLFLRETLNKPPQKGGDELKSRRNRDGDAMFIG